MSAALHGPTPGRTVVDEERILRSRSVLIAAALLGLPLLVVGSAYSCDRATQERAAREPVSARTVTVEPGESLWSIAARELGDGDRWREIFELNAIVDPRQLRVGTELRIPCR